MAAGVFAPLPLPGRLSDAPLARAQTALTYPAARLADQVDDYHGTLVADPYRWLENADSAETQAWVGAEATFANNYLTRIPGRLAIARHYDDLLNYERYTVPFKRS